MDLVSPSVAGSNICEGYRNPVPLTSWMFLQRRGVLLWAPFSYGPVEPSQWLRIFDALSVLISARLTRFGFVPGKRCLFSLVCLLPQHRPRLGCPLRVLRLGFWLLPCSVAALPFHSSRECVGPRLKCRSFRPGLVAGTFRWLALV